MTRQTPELQPREDALELLPSDTAANAFHNAVPGISKPAGEEEKRKEPSLGLAAYLRKIDR